MQQTVELPQVQHTDEIVDEAIVMRDQVPTIQTAHTQRQVPVIQKAQRTAEDIRIPLIVVEQTADVIQVIPQEHVLERTVKAAQGRASDRGTADSGSSSESVSPSSGTRARCDAATDVEISQGRAQQGTLLSLDTSHSSPRTTWNTRQMKCPRSAALARAKADSDSAKRERAL